MMTSGGAQAVQDMLLSGADAVLADVEALTKLDSAIGDGDHGLAMSRAMHALKEAVKSSSKSTLKDLLFRISWTIMSSDGGSTGPLLGAFFMGMSNAAGQIGKGTSREVCTLIEAGVENLCWNTRARIGDKTMMDALLPAVEALKDCQNREDVGRCLAAAAAAAKHGARNTASMQARFGRARHLGSRAIGHVDPGAMSMALMLQGFAAAFENPNDDPGAEMRHSD